MLARAYAPSLIARGDVPAVAPVLESPIEGVSDIQWGRYVRAIRTKAVSAVTESNALGMFEMKPRRLGDLGLVTDLKSVRGPTGRMVWMGRFVAPMTGKKFLSNPSTQYRVMLQSTRDYADRIRAGSITVPKGVSLSGALAILHRAGPSGLKNIEELFPSTKALYDRARDLF